MGSRVMDSSKIVLRLSACRGQGLSRIDSKQALCMDVEYHVGLDIFIQYGLKHFILSHSIVSCASFTPPAPKWLSHSRPCAPLSSEQCG